MNTIISKVKKINPLILSGLLFIFILVLISSLLIIAPTHRGMTKKYATHSKNIILFLFMLQIIIGIGEILLILLKFNFKKENFLFRYFLSFGAGCVVLSQLVFILSFFHILIFSHLILPVILFIFLLPLLLLFWRDFNSYLWNNLSQSNSFTLYLKKSLYFLPLLPLVFSLILVFAPPIAWDAQTYHLAIPKKFLADGGISFFPLNIYSNMPFNMNLLYTFAMGIGGEELVRLLCGFISLMLILGFGAIAKLEFGDEKGGWLAGLIFLASPVILYGANEVLVDVQMAFFVILAVWTFLRWLEEQKLLWILLCGIFCGFISACKYTGIYIPIAIFLIGIFLSQKEKRKEILLIPLFAILFLLPWFLKNYLLTGNPIYPLLYNVFDGRDWTSQMYAFLIDWQKNIGMGRSFVDYLLLPLRVFFMSDEGYQYFAGKLSALPLIFFIFSFAIENKRKRWLLIGISIISFCEWAYGSQQVRFLIPTIVIFALSGAIGLTSILKKSKKSDVLIFLLLLLILPITIISNLENFKIIKESLPYILGRQSKDTYLTNHIWSYSAFKFIEKNTPKNEKVLFIFENFGYYCPREYFADGMFEASYLIDLASKEKTTEGLKNEIRKQFNVNLILVNTNILKMIEEGIKSRERSPFKNPENIKNYIEGFNIIKMFIDTECEKIFEFQGSVVYKIIY